MTNCYKLLLVGKKKFNFIVKLKLKPITFYTYNYKNIINVIFLYIYYHLIFSLALEENFFPYFPVCFFKSRVGQLFLFLISK